MSEYQAVCFDLDGTLLDSLEDLAICTNGILKKKGFPEHPLEAYNYFVGDGAKMLMTRVLPEAERSDDLIEECRQQFEIDYAECWDQNTRPYDGIPELLNELQIRKLKMAALSNKPHTFTVQFVNHLLKDWDFEVVFGQREGIPRKPDPAGMIEISKKMGVPTEAFLYLGDTATDMKTAKEAGCFAVGVLWGFRPEKELVDNGAQAIIKQPLDLISLLK